MKLKDTNIVLLLLLVGTSLLGALSLDEAQAQLKIIDLQSNFKELDFSARVSMITEDPDDGIEKNVVQQFRRDDEDKFLLLFQEPAVKKGQGYLNIDDNLWFYDPESRKFSHTTMKDSFGGSDAKNSDFNQSSMEEDYEVKGVGEGTLGKYDVYIFELEAKNNEVTYPSQKMWITKSDSLPLKIENYSSSGRLMRTSLYPSYKKLSGKFIPTRMIFTDELIEGKKTQIRLSELSTRELPDTLFTKSYVERVNR